MPDVYTCRLLPDGTGSASTFLMPMLDAWAADHGISLYSGTLNLCADRPVALPEERITLAPYEQLAQPSWRRTQPGFSPRLYRVVLDEATDAWLYRWSEQADLRTFVGDADGCTAERRCEIVATVRLRDHLGIGIGDVISLRVT